MYDGKGYKIMRRTVDYVMHGRTGCRGVFFSKLQQMLLTMEEEEADVSRVVVYASIIQVSSSDSTHLPLPVTVCIPVSATASRNNPRPTVQGNLVISSAGQNDMDKEVSPIPG